MKLLGLTGGVGMGKSTVAGLFQGVGLPVADTDLLARQVVEPGQPAADEIAEAFGWDVLDASGGLRRGMLADIVFADPVARQRLEAIIHPRVRALWHRQAELWRLAGSPAGVVVVPLLFETRAESEFDAVVCVACSAATQSVRLIARGWSETEAARRQNAQWPTETKMVTSDRVIWTEGRLELAAEQVRRVLRQMNLLGLE